MLKRQLIMLSYVHTASKPLSLCMTNDKVPKYSEHYLWSSVLRILLQLNTSASNRAETGDEKTRETMYCVILKRVQPRTNDFFFPGSFNGAISQIKRGREKKKSVKCSCQGNMIWHESRIVHCVVQSLISAVGCLVYLEASQENLRLTAISLAFLNRASLQTIHPEMSN